MELGAGAHRTSHAAHIAAVPWAPGAQMGPMMPNSTAALCPTRPARRAPTPSPLLPASRSWLCTVAPALAAPMTTKRSGSSSSSCRYCYTGRWRPSVFMRSGSCRSPMRPLTTWRRPLADTRQKRGDCLALDPPPTDRRSTVVMYPPCKDVRPPQSGAHQYTACNVQPATVNKNPISLTEL